MAILFQKIVPGIGGEIWPSVFGALGAVRKGRLPDQLFNGNHKKNHKSRSPCDGMNVLTDDRSGRGSTKDGFQLHFCEHLVLERLG